VFDNLQAVDYLFDASPPRKPPPHWPNTINNVNADVTLFIATAMNWVEGLGGLAEELSGISGATSYDFNSLTVR
jgi:hypothetical protein